MCDCCQGSAAVVRCRGETLKLIPYYSWANRGQGKMMVWLPVEAGAVHLGPALRVGTNEFLDK